jgi:hypothetical protein
VKRIFSLFLVLLLGTPVFADENTDAAGEFLVTCGKRLPETKKTVQILKDDGWRYESTDGRFHFYSQNGRRVLAATSVTSSAQQGCLAAVARLKDAGAIALAESTAKALGLTPMPEKAEPGILGVWGGTFNGRNLGLAAFPSADFGFIRGASLIMVLE